MLAIGLSVYGVARVFTHRTGGFVILGVGFLAIVVVRPHMAVLVFIGLALGYLLRPVPRGPTPYPGGPSPAARRSASSPSPSPGPFPFEAHNAQALASSLEGALLLAFFGLAAPRVLAGLKRSWRSPFVVHRSEVAPDPGDHLSPTR
jgi:hypothetical protein